MIVVFTTGNDGHPRGGQPRDEHGPTRWVGLEVRTIMEIDPREHVDPPERPVSILITGAGGYIGRELVRQLARMDRPDDTVVGVDIRPVPKEERFAQFAYETADIRSEEMGNLMERYRPDVVVHLASIVTPSKSMTREFLYSVDVLGTKNVVGSCLKSGVEKLIVTSSGAAYGYHADNPRPLSEDDPLRGNEEFAYSDHKRQVEEMLAQYRTEHPELEQLILRPGTILGENVSNQITNLFEKRTVIGLKGTDIPFVFIWDRDVVVCILKSIYEPRNGIFNLAGDGTLTMEQIAAILQKPYRPKPVWLVKFGLWFLKLFRLTQYGPEQVNFLRYRPVLANDALKEEFGYTPQLTTREVFDLYRHSVAGSAAGNDE